MDQLFSAQGPFDGGGAPVSPLQGHGGHDDLSADKTENDGNGQGSGKGHALRQPGRLPALCPFPYAVAVEKDEQDRSDVDAGLGFGRTDHEGQDQGRDGQGLYRRLFLHQLPEDGRAHQKKVSRGHDGGSAGVFPDFVDQRKCDHDAGRYGIEPDLFLPSVQQIHDADGHSGPRHQLMDGQELIYIGSAVPERKELFPQYCAPAVLTEPDSPVHVEGSRQIVHADGPVHHGEAVGSPGKEKHGDPVGLLFNDIVIELFQYCGHGIILSENTISHYTDIGAFFPHSDF